MGNVNLIKILQTSKTLWHPKEEKKYLGNTKYPFTVSTGFKSVTVTKTFNNGKSHWHLFKISSKHIQAFLFVCLFLLHKRYIFL